jgi:hypothetical protein
MWTFFKIKFEMATRITPASSSSMAIPRSLTSGTEALSLSRPFTNSFRALREMPRAVAARSCTFLMSKGCPASLSPSKKRTRFRTRVWQHAWNTRMILALFSGGSPILLSVNWPTNPPNI